MRKQTKAKPSRPSRIALLESRLAAAEARIAILEARPAQLPLPTYTMPGYEPYRGTTAPFRVTWADGDSGSRPWAREWKS